MPSKKEWASEEQSNFLKEWLEKYITVQKKGQFDKFWPKLDEAWFERYPERTTLFGVVENLTPEEENQLGTAIQKRKRVCFCTHLVHILLSQQYLAIEKLD